MTDFIIEINNGTDTGTIRPDVGFSYEINLNELNESNIKVFGSGAVKRGLVTEGSTLTIKRNGTLEFKGYVNFVDFLDGGGLSISADGYEIWLAKEKGTYANSPWSSTASATIFSAVMGDSTKFSAGTTDAGADIDYRASTSENIWGVIHGISKKTGQDIGIDYANDEVDILDHLGSSTSVATLNEGKEIKNVRASKAAPTGNYVIVYGKGDGANQIKSTPATNGVDDTSVSAYGQITRHVIDRRIVSVSEANALADIEVAITKDPVKVYDFEVVNPTLNYVLGDVLTLNSPDKNISSESVRIVSIKRGMRGNNEFLKYQVTNTGYSKRVGKRNKLLQNLSNTVKNSDTYMQGSTNEISQGNAMNADSSTPLIINFTVPASMQDEAGNMRVNSMTLDYDVDKFKQQTGSASFDGLDPQVNGTSSSTTPSATTGISVWSTQTIDYVASGNVVSVGYVESNLVGSPVLYTTRVQCILLNWTGGAVDVTPKFNTAANNVITFATDYSLADSSFAHWQDGEDDADNASGSFWAWDDNYNATTCSGTQMNVYTHSHGSHTHEDGGYDISATDIDNISIGDGVGEAGSTNASEVNIYLDYYSAGVPGWVNKHSVLTTGETLEQNVDITDSGTYPDSYGLWRVRILTDSASADFVQGIVKLKGAVDA